MGVLDILQNMFTQDPSQAPDGRAMNSPLIQFLESSGMSPKIDEASEKRKAIARGLMEFSKRISGSNQDFLPALAGAIPYGAEGYLNQTDKTDETRRKRSQDLMEKMFGIAKTEDSNNTRTEIADQRSADTNARLNMLEQQGNRRLDISEQQGGRRLDQGDTRLDQSGERIDETGRHNLVTEGQTNDRIQQGGDRLKFQTEKAKADAEKSKAELANAASKAKLTDAQIANLTTGIIEKKLKMKKSELGLDEPSFRILDPEGHAAATTEFQAYADELTNSLNPGAPATTASPSVAPAPTPEAATPQVQYSKENPAKPMTQADFDALPSGAIFVNPRDGKLLRKK